MYGGLQTACSDCLCIASLLRGHRSLQSSHASACSLLALQVEIKLRLPSKEAHDEVAKQLKDSFRETHQQENFFFDGTNGELSSQRVVLRCRFYNHDKRAIVTLKVLIHLCTHWELPIS